MFACGPLLSRLLLVCGCRAFAPVARPWSRTTEAPAAAEWVEAGLCEALSERLVSAGLERPTGIQAACFGPLAAGEDAVVHAETGSGKTLAYALPLASAGRSFVVVVAPGRALAAQIRSALERCLGAEAAARFAVATPKELLRGGAGALDQVRADAIVVDEADAVLRAGKG